MIAILKSLKKCVSFSMTKDYCMGKLLSETKQILSNHAAHVW